MFSLRAIVQMSGESCTLSTRGKCTKKKVALLLQPFTCNLQCKQLVVSNYKNPSKGCGWPHVNGQNMPEDIFLVFSHLYGLVCVCFPFTAKQKKRKLVQSNEDLFYDPDIDDQNQKWVDKQRSRYYPTKPGSDTHPSSDKTTPSGGCQSKPNMAAAKSDAILNCPACMTTLCLDCQRHELYPTQYRAMFVLNCLIVRSEKLKFKPGQKKKRKWKRKSNKGGPNEDAGEASTADESGVEESYHPVRCAECNTEVAVYDCEEVYHFFNVITGIAWEGN